jgi:hypothetical protein
MRRMPLVNCVGAGSRLRSRVRVRGSSPATPFFAATARAASAIVPVVVFSRHCLQEGVVGVRTDRLEHDIQVAFDAEARAN